jgi:hypothetical protein
VKSAQHSAVTAQLYVSVASVGFIFWTFQGSQFAEFTTCDHSFFCSSTSSLETGSTKSKTGATSIGCTKVSSLQFHSQLEKSARAIDFEPEASARGKYIILGNHGMG